MSKRDQDRYFAAAHAVQSGIAHEMQLDERDGKENSATTPKHLRVGVNSAKVEQGGLAKLLIAKGVFTLDEYDRALADAMEEEKARYEKILSERLGANVGLA